MPRPILVALLVALAATGAEARPAAWRLDPQASRVGFGWAFGGQQVQGVMQVAEADLTLDLADLAACRIAVAVDVRGAEAGFPFATEALKGPRVLDAGRFPRITFRSTRVSAEGTGARIDGEMTIRGVTRPAVLHARFHRQPGTAAGERDHLEIDLTGAVSRAAFGASGWSDLAGDEVRLRILARIDRE